MFMGMTNRVRYIKLHNMHYGPLLSFSELVSESARITESVSRRTHTVLHYNLDIIEIMVRCTISSLDVNLRCRIIINRLCIFFSSSFLTKSAQRQKHVCRSSCVDDSTTDSDSLSAKAMSKAANVKRDVVEYYYRCEILEAPVMFSMVYSRVDDD